MKKIELELIPNPGMYIFFEKGIRGGITYISDRYRKGNNRHLKSHDRKNESNILYQDVNKLYCYAMTIFIRTSRFKWIHSKEVDLNEYTSNRMSKRII